MRLSQVLAPQVSNRTRSRGASYAVTGAVASLERHGRIIQAVVTGSEPYDVLIEQTGARLRSTCTCPYFLDHLEICKHIWAVILTAESRGIPLIEPGPAPSRITLEPSDFNDDLASDDEDHDDDAWLPVFTPPAPEKSMPAARKRSAPPPWQTILERIAGTHSEATPPPTPRLVPGQLLYVLDVAATHQAGTAVMELMTRERKKSGDWGKPRPIYVTGRDVHLLPDCTDRDILERLLGVSPDAGTGAPLPGGTLARFHLEGALLPDTLPAMCREGRCLARVADEASGVAPPDAARPSRYWSPRPKAQPTLLLPLAFDDGPAWRFDATIRRDEETGVYRINGALTRDDERMDIGDPLLVLAGGFLITRSHVARLDHGGAFAWLAGLRRERPIDVPLASRPALLDTLLTRPLPARAMPDDLQVIVEDGAPRPALRLTPGSWHQLEAAVSMRYGDLEIAAAAPQPVIRTADASRVVRRDLGAERTFVDRLRPLGFRAEWSLRAQAAVPQLPAERLPRAVRALLDDGWHVEAQGITYRRPGAVSLAVRSGIDWFDVEGGVDYDGHQVPLPALLAAMRRGETFVTLDDGTHGLLPEEWLEQSGALVRMGKQEGDSIRFTRPQAALLDALLAAQPAVTCDETFARARAEIASFDGITAVDPPAAFTGTLREYQRRGLGWLLFLRRFGFGGCLADDMGLGKTVMVLALLAHIRDKSRSPAPSLVVAPRSLVFNWRQEAARFAPSLRVLDYTGTGRTVAREAIPSHDLVLTTYGTLRRDAAHLAQIPFEYVVLDEAQAIKNASSASAKAARLLRPRHRLALSGTPIENHLGELWSLFEFLNPGVLGSSAAFAASTGSGRLDEDAVALLARGLRPFILRRTKEQVAPELPPKTEQDVYCELERPQRALYNELRDHYRQSLLARANGSGLGRAKLQVLEALLRLRQAACHPGLLDPKRTKDASAKLDVLLPRLLEAVEEGHKTLVFSQFTSLLAIVRRALDAQKVEYEYLDGRTRDREQRVVRFQTDPDCRLFLISLKAGGVGLNLTAAEYVFLLDPWWNPAVEAQAIDRTHRIGQSRHVFAYRLIAKDTVEERVLELQRQKRSLADAVLTADESLLRSLKREDLELLLS